MLFYFLHEFFSEHLVSNLFRYISFRALLAAVFSFLFVVLLMPRLIRLLSKLSVRQVVRNDGPKTHLKKSGTPTMGGVLMVMGILLSTLLLCRLENTYVLISIFSLLGFGAVGFLDDYLKLTKKNPKGVSFRAKMITMGLLSIAAAFWMLESTSVESKLVIPFVKNFSLELGAFFIFGPSLSSMERRMP